MFLSGEPLREKQSCKHCGESVEDTSQEFCCRGCEGVYTLLAEKGFQRFYSIRQKQEIVNISHFKKRSFREQFASLEKDRFDYLDDPSFIAEYGNEVGSGKSMRFFMEGIHCSACVWLGEQLPSFVPGLKHARLSLSSSMLELEIEGEGSFARCAETLATLGYRIVPVQSRAHIDQLERREVQKTLIRLAVAGACAGNIMLLATSLYAGAEEPFATFFRLLTGCLALPVLTFSAWPFYAQALSALKLRRVSIDLPLSLGLLLGAIPSYVSLLRGEEALYFDSLTSFVFLMLATRLFLRRTQGLAEQAFKAAYFLVPAKVHLKVGAQFETHPLEAVLAGSILEVRPQEKVPVDGILMSDQACIDRQILTGESQWLVLEKGVRLEAGCVNQGGLFLMEATCRGDESRMLKILQEAERDLAKKSEIVQFSDFVARVYMGAIGLAVCGLMLSIIWLPAKETIELALGLAIVTCPCGFALATPLAMSLTLARLSRAGILVRGDAVLERLATVTHVFLDKTGTLTEGHYTLAGVSFEGRLLEPEALPAKWQSLLLALESKSQHPIAIAIRRAFPQAPTLVLQDLDETFGQGVAGTYQGERVVLVSSQTQSEQTSVELFVEKEPVLKLFFKDKLRAETPSLIRALKDMRLDCKVISGDQVSVLAPICAGLGVEMEAGCTPERKRRIVSRVGASLMVGDGANDAPALASSSVGIAVRGSLEMSLRSSDIYLQSVGVGALPSLIRVAQETLKVIYRNFLLSLLYNLAGIVGVVMGWVSPLYGAVLMPISAILVFSSSFIGTRQQRVHLERLSR